VSLVSSVKLALGLPPLSDSLVLKLRLAGVSLVLLLRLGLEISPLSCSLVLGVGLRVGDPLWVTP